MPWEVSSVLERRIRFVLDVERGELPLTAVCEAHGISRTTGYKWLERHASWGISGLSDRPRTPGRLARAMAPEIASAIVAARTRYPHWGRRSCGLGCCASSGGRLAGGIDDGRSAAPAWFERAAAWSAARAGADAAVRGGADAARFVVHRFQGLVSHAGRATLRPSDGERCGEPLSSVLLDCGTDDGGGLADPLIVCSANMVSRQRCGWTMARRFARPERPDYRGFRYVG